MLSLVSKFHPVITFYILAQNLQNGDPINYNYILPTLQRPASNVPLPKGNLRSLQEYFRNPADCELPYPKLSCVIINYTLDRTILRCNHCDLVATNKRAMDAEFPPPTRESPVEKIEKHIKQAEELITEGIRKEDLEKTLPVMRTKLKEAIALRERKVDKAWREHWGIWGKGKFEFED
ncbi:hypothetical protein G7Y89_g154 [Cudoniella acicularis]|uniref:Uncharacterized protein n=1 Tax=Cudoniella acicularis TaxID=354080 RepID=A0A8H4S0F2_9HELO|nr:hypothetical protein G7Y89_g154 [Cudoniella acicularis]